MQITFDPHNPDDLAMITRLLGSAANPPAPVQPDEGHPAAYTAEQANPPAADEPAAEEPVGVDTHGMEWDESIHSSPPNKNADGSWRARRGKKDEYEAAIIAHKSASTADAGQTLAESAPAAPAPQTPPVAIDYGVMAERFVAKMKGLHLPVEYEKVYSDLDVAYADLETNQTSIARLWHYMDALDQGLDHAGAIRHARGLV